MFILLYNYFTNDAKLNFNFTIKHHFKQSFFIKI
jgi:hypothetical protein